MLYPLRIFKNRQVNSGLYDLSLHRWNVPWNDMSGEPYTRLLYVHRGRAISGRYGEHTVSLARKIKGRTCPIVTRHGLLANPT